MVSYVPTIHGEQKTKPTQHAVKSIRSSGLIPDVVCYTISKSVSLLIHSRLPVAASILLSTTRSAIALHCQAEQRQVIVVRDMPSIYQVPMLLREQELLPILLSQLSLDPTSVPQSLVAKGTQIWDSWKSLTMTTHESTVRIALVGKYTKTPDAYMSLVKSLEHAAMHIRRNLDLIWIDAEHLEAEPETSQKAWEMLRSASGISQFYRRKRQRALLTFTVIPGGFGERGVEGMMLASKWARENKIPFLGVSHT